MAMAGGLRGRKLSLAVWGVAMWAIIISGFNQASAGGILGNANFLEQFPQLNASGPDAQHKSTIQGEFHCCGGGGGGGGCWKIIYTVLRG